MQKRRLKKVKSLNKNKGGNSVKSRVSRNILLLFLLLLAILLMGIGYAVINSVTGEIKGNVIANVQNDVFITNVEYVSDVDANLTISEIQSYKSSLMQSTVELSSTNPASEIKYKVTVYNNSANSYPFLSVLYDGTNSEFYDNENIIFEIDPSGFNVGDVINANETKESIESIKFEQETVEPEGIIASFDASEKQNESIIGYYTDVDGNDLYELTFLSDEVIAANKNAQYLFQYLTSLTSIEFNNFSTFGVTSMLNMFYGCSGLESLDVSKFDTSQVTNMDSMFAKCSGLTELDVSNFDTSKVNNMGAMFSGCSGLTELDVSNFDTSKVTTMNYMFNSCSGLTELDVSDFDTSQVTTMKYMFQYCINLTTIYVSEFNAEANTGWTTSAVTDSSNMFSNCSSIIGGNGTTYNSSYIDATYARIDTEEEPGYLTNILDKP